MTKPSIPLTRNSVKF